VTPVAVVAVAEGSGVVNSMGLISR
jgi:hypothetical protein